MQTIRIQVLFTTEEGGQSFTDALYFTPEEFAEKSQADIDAAKSARCAAWQEQLAKPAVEPTKAELEESAADLARQLDAVQTKIAEMSAKEDVGGK